MVLEDWVSTNVRLEINRYQIYCLNFHFTTETHINYNWSVGLISCRCLLRGHVYLVPWGTSSILSVPRTAKCDWSGLFTYLIGIPDHRNSENIRHMHDSKIHYLD